VLVKIAFIPINPTDLLLIDNLYRFTTSPPYLVGREGSGTVVAVGSDLKVPHNIGDKVHIHAEGTIGEYAIAPSEEVSPIKYGLSMEDAASHVINPATVDYMVALAERGGHKAVISTAASSALGKMLIRILKEKGIKTINTVRQDKYIEELKKEGADYVLNSESPDFEAQLKEIAAKENATIAFDAINGDFTHRVIKNQPPNSSIYIYGFLSGGSFADLFQVKTLEDGKSIKPLLYINYLKEFSDKNELPQFYDRIHSLLPTVYKTGIQAVYPFEKIHEAIDFYKANSSKGKVLVKFD